MSRPELFIEAHGHGPPLVLLHGWGMHSGVFEDPAEALLDRYRVHLVDLPGQGRSPWPEGGIGFEALAAQLRSRLPTDSVWIGWSLGGLLAMQVALLAPAAVRHLVLLCSAPSFVRRPGWPCGMAPSVLRDFHGALRRDHRATLNRFLALEVMGTEDAGRQLRILRRLLFQHGQPDPRALDAGLKWLLSVDLRARMQRLRCPLRLLLGRRDRLVSPASGAATLALVPAADCRILDWAGHAPFLSHPREFETALAWALGENVLTASGPDMLA